MSAIPIPPGAVLGKTSKGRDEVQARERALAPALRHLLILADGKRTAQELLRITPDPTKVQGGLELLMREGYLEAVGSAAPAAARAPAAPAVPAGELKERLLQLVTAEFPGQQRLHEKVTAAADEPAALREAVAGCVKYIRMFIDQARADDFARRATALLDQAGA